MFSHLVTRHRFSHSMEGWRMRYVCRKLSYAMANVSLSWQKVIFICGGNISKGANHRLGCFCRCKEWLFSWGFCAKLFSLHFSLHGFSWCNLALFLTIDKVSIFLPILSSLGICFIRPINVIYAREFQLIQ